MNEILKLFYPSGSTESTGLYPLCSYMPRGCPRIHANGQWQGRKAMARYHMRLREQAVIQPGLLDYHASLLTTAPTVVSSW
jgi:hypothetical protein